MSDVVTGTSSAVVADNPYITVLNRRIRASCAYDGDRLSEYGGEN